MGDVQTIGSHNQVARFSYTSDEPIQMTFSIYGPSGLANYTPPGVAFVEHYDPYSNQIVVDTFPIGGNFGNTAITIVTGSLVNLGSGEVKIRVIDRYRSANTSWWC